MTYQAIYSAEKYSLFDGQWSPKMFAETSDYQFKIGKGEMYVVPKGVEHKPFAEKDIQLMLIEPRGVTNTGSEESELTAENDVWI